MISDIMHSFAHDKGKPVEKRGRKTTGLRGKKALGQRSYRSEQGLQVNNNAKKRACVLHTRLRSLHR